MRRQLLFELNEFNTELLEEAARVMDAPNLARLMTMRRGETVTEDIYDDGSLEPWVQWISVHTGVPYRDHGILHIGDVPDEGHPQLWEVLSDAGITSGVWGVLNGIRRGAEHCKFFVPDPWTFSEDAYPRELQGLIALPRFLAKHRTDIVRREALPLAMDMARTFARPKDFAAGVAAAMGIVPQWRHDVDKAYVYFTPFEYLSAQRFFQYKKAHDPAFSVLFVNMLAHAQHYYWDPTDLKHNARMQYVLAHVDKVLGLVFDNLAPDEDLVVMNSFNQFNIVGDIDHKVYRQRDHAAFLGLAGLTFRLVDAHMTNDAHLYTETPADLQRAVAVLSAATIAGQPLFDVQTYDGEPTKLFFRVRFGAPVAVDGTFEIAGQALRFWDHFEVLGQHTGRHGQRGTIFSTREDLPAEMANHEVFQWLLDPFDIGTGQAGARDVNQVSRAGTPG